MSGNTEQVAVDIKNRSKSLIAATLLVAATVLGTLSTAHAATLTSTYIRLDRMKAAQTTSFRLVFRTVSAGATSVAINFNGADVTTWTASSGLVNATQTVSSVTCATETGFTGLPGSITAAGSSATVTISAVTALSATTTYCVDLTSASAVTTATAGEYHPTITVGSDSTTTSVRTISNDQVVVSAVVPPSFNFVLDGNTTSFTANLDSTAVRSTTGRTITITTNAANGWVAWIKDLNQGLQSAVASKTIATSGTINATPNTLSAGTEGYVLDADLTTDAASGGTVTIAAEYNGGANAGGTLSSSFQPIATSTGTAGGSGDVITLVGKAAIAGDTPAAADYTDTWTIIGAGTF